MVVKYAHRRRKWPHHTVCVRTPFELQVLGTGSGDRHPLRNLQIDTSEGRRRPKPLDYSPDTDRGRPAAPGFVGLRLRQRGHAVRVTPARCITSLDATPDGLADRVALRKARHQGCTWEA